jgi:hypothetical protein
MTDDSDDFELRREPYDQYDDADVPTPNQDDDKDVLSLGVAVDEGWGDDIGSGDLQESGVVSATLSCDDCGEEMDVSAGSSNYECSCGHSVRTIAVPARMMDELE